MIVHVKEYLGQLKFIEFSIKAYEQTIEQIRKSSSGLITKYSDMPKAVRNTGLEEKIVRLEEEMEKLNESILHLIHVRELLTKQINELGDFRLSSVLHMYYINNLTREAIAIELKRHPTTIGEWKKEGEELFAKVHNDLFVGKTS